MTDEPRHFTRLVLGLHSNASDHALQVAVDIADGLHLDLLGLFLEDENLRDFARFPFARELSFTGTWHAVDHDRMVHDLEIAARSVERAFAKAVKNRVGTSRFEVMRGPAAHTIEAMSSSADIVVVAEPSSAAERLAVQFSDLLTSALRSSAAVLIVPPSVAHRRGSVVALAATVQDPSVETAAAIASATKEALVVVVPDSDGEESRKYQMARLRSGSTVHWLHVKKNVLSDLSACVAELLSIERRLIVMTRSASDGNFASAVAYALQTPVLVIEEQRGGAANL